MSLPGLPLERGVSGINANARDVVLSWLEKQKDISRDFLIPIYPQIPS